MRVSVRPSSLRWIGVYTHRRGRGWLGFCLMCSTCWGSASSRRRALLLCLGLCRALTLRGWSSRLLVWAPRLRGFCGLWWPLVGVWAGRSPLLRVSWLARFRGCCWSPGCSPGLLRGVRMDRGGLDGLSFERGGLQCALCLGGWPPHVMRSSLLSLLRLLRLGRSSRCSG